ncbi:MAG: magnesium transporter [Verrucomicrobiota bacterium]
MSDTEQPSLPTQDAEAYTLDELRDLFAEQGVVTMDGKRLEATPPYTVGSFLSRLDVDDRREVLRRIPIEHAKDVLAEMDADDAAKVVEAMREQRAVKILEELDPDDSADIVGEMEDADRERLLDKVDDETEATVRELIAYDSDTAGGIMTTEVATARPSMTVIQTVRHIQKLNDEFEHIFYVYVIDEEQRLLGVLSMRDLVMHGPLDYLRDIMTDDIAGICQVDEDQEEVARRMAELNLNALPVVDDEDRLVGMITHDDVLDIVLSEATEDIQKMVGAGGDEAVDDPIRESIQRRSPWLVVNLVTALLAGAVVYAFEKQISELTILAVCMPVVANLGGNTGAQTLAVIIRSLALGQIQTGEDRRICLREGIKGLLNGLLIGVLSAGIVGLFTSSAMTALVVFIAMILSMTYAGTAGALIPILLNKVGFDPAQSSSIFVTASTDIVGFAIFLGLGSWLLL